MGAQPFTIYGYLRLGNRVQSVAGVPQDTKGTGIVRPPSEKASPPYELLAATMSITSWMG
jgi:hypothetical protein